MGHMNINKGYLLFDLKLFLYLCMSIFTERFSDLCLQGHLGKLL